jgi:type VI secretion system secreted protein VgrG
MADQLKQSGRVADFNTPLGKDVLVLIKINGNEGLGELFQYNIEALSEQENIDFDKALGQGCTVKLKAYQGKERAFNGIMTQARWIGKLEDYHRYQLVLRPWLYLLGHKANCRIFLEKNVKDIIKEVFTKGGFNDFEFRTNEDYDKLHYTAQHRETDLAFVHRLMEQYGIYYFFEHSDSKHTLVLADSRSSHKPSPDLPKVPFIPLTKSESRGDQHLYEWISERHLRTGQVRFNDYDYVKPKKNLVAPSEASESYTNSKLQVYDFPGKYDEQDKGKKLSRVRLEAAQALDHRRHIRGDAASLYPGALVTVEKHPTSGENQEYLVVRSSPRFSSHHYRSVAALDEGAAPHEQERPDIVSDPEQDQVHYGSYEFQPSDHPFRMAQETPQPKIYGIQTALVVGKTGEEGEEISTDELGRIWVQFPWDADPLKSYALRIAQTWAGNKWGAIFIPRVGMEVVVEFENGDPDRPLVVGCVYNGENKLPYDLPANKTKAGWKSNSSKGGGGYNEFAFEDKKGSEDIIMHAEKDHHVTVKNSETRTIGEVFMPPQGSPSRNVTLKNGDDQLDIQMGNQTITLDMGSQTVSAMQGITLQVCYGLSTIVITPASISLTSPTINLTAEADINLTAPTINITGVVNITGSLTVDGMVPMLLPA